MKRVAEWLAGSVLVYVGVACGIAVSDPVDSAQAEPVVVKTLFCGTGMGSPSAAGDIVDFSPSDLVDLRAVAYREDGGNLNTGMPHTSFRTEPVAIEGTVEFGCGNLGQFVDVYGPQSVLDRLTPKQMDTEQ